MRWSVRLSALLASLLLIACAGGRTPSAVGGGDGPSVPAAPKRVVAALMANPTTVFLQAAAGNEPGMDVLQALVHSGLSIVDGRGVLVPQLAVEIPSQENGLWKVFPGGQMETTYRIRVGAYWHDGTAVTTDDLLFSLEVSQDRGLPRFVYPNLRYVDGAEASDARTMTVRWKQPFIEADTLFGAGFVAPLPRHLLETSYRQNRANWENLPYWGAEAIGAGPFKIADWVPGSHMVLQAFDQYVLGRPKIDVLEIRFIPDGNTLVANVLAGDSELTLGRSISVEQAAQLDRWADGKVVTTPLNLVYLFWQFLNPDPPALLDTGFRRALLRAIDREEMAEELQRSVSPAAYSVLYPGQYPEIEGRLPRSEYDSRLASTELQGLGYRPAADGRLQEAGGKPLAVGVLVGEELDINVRTAFAVADYWKKVGVDASVTVRPARLQGTAKLQMEAEWPGFTAIRTGAAPAVIQNLHSGQARMPETGFNGNNRGRYVNSDLDVLLDRFAVTIPLRERTAILGALVQMISDQVLILPLFYGAEPMAIANRLANVGPRPAGGNGNPAWNAHEWDVKG